MGSDGWLMTWTGSDYALPSTAQRLIDTDSWSQQRLPDGTVRETISRDGVMLYDSAIPADRRKRKRQRCKALEALHQWRS